jgi:hypothetical protein
MRCSMLNIIGKLLHEEHGPKIVFIKGIHNTVADQSHHLSMTPVSIEQLRATLQQKSIRSKKQSETKLDSSLKYNGAN